MTATILDRKSTRLNSSHTEIYTLSLHDALPISRPKDGSEGQVHPRRGGARLTSPPTRRQDRHDRHDPRSEEHTSELQSHRDLHSFPTRRSSDLPSQGRVGRASPSAERRCAADIPADPTPGSA